MANPTTNFGWQMPTSTDLVTDLPADFEIFGQAVDTALVDLKGGTTGQVLAKATDTDMDFTWVAQDDSNAIQNAIVDAKGDLIAASAADTPARLAVGANGETLVADSSTATGLKYAKQGMAFISRTSFSAVTSATFDSVFTSAYDTYCIIVEDCFATTGTDDLLFQFRFGSTTRNSGYTGSSAVLPTGGSTWTNVPSSAAASMVAIIDLGSASSGLSNGTYWVNQVGQSSQKGAIRGTYNSGNGFIPGVMGGMCDANETFTGFILTCASNMTGTVAIYGLGK